MRQRFMLCVLLPLGCLCKRKKKASCVVCMKPCQYWLLEDTLVSEGEVVLVREDQVVEYGQFE